VALVVRRFVYIHAAWRHRHDVSFLCFGAVLACHALRLLLRHNKQSHLCCFDLMLLLLLLLLWLLWLWLL
jgi:hypothetical protein